MSKGITGPLAPRLPFWTFATEICGIGEPGSKVQLTTAQRALWRSYDRRVGLTEAEGEAYREMTGKAPWKVGSKAPPFLLMTLSRGGGKSLLLATIAVFEAITNSYVSAPGETVAVVALAPRLKQSKDLFRYSKAHLERPALAPFVESSVQEEIRLTNGRLLRTQAVDKSGGAARGPTYICALFDESAFLNRDGLIVDAEQWQAILAGARGVSDFRGVLSSTPNGKSGFFWETFDENFGKDGASWEVFSGPQPLIRKDMEPGLLQEYQRSDPEAFKREFLCDFAAGTGAERFFVPAQVESCIAAGCIEVPSTGPLSSYACAVDPSGGAHDKFTCCVVERLEDGSVRQCLARAWDPKESSFSVNAIAIEIAEIVAPYGIRNVYGDIFGGQWVSEAFAAAGLEYQVRGFNGQNKLQRASCLRELFTTQRIRLLDIPEQTRELCEYEKKTLSSGQVSVNHPNTKTGSDDRLDSLALAVWELVGQITELHPPDFLKAVQFKEQCRLYKGGKFPALAHRGRLYLTAREVADIDPASAWLASNAFKDADVCLWSLGEIAHAMRITARQAMCFFGRDTVLQHNWFRWFLAVHKGRTNERMPLLITQPKPKFPALPASAEVFKRIAAEGEHIIRFSPSRNANSVPMLSQQYLAPLDAEKERNKPYRPWPCDLLESSGSRGLIPACRPWAPPREEWSVSIFGKSEDELSGWNMDRDNLEHRQAIEDIFFKGEQERKAAQVRIGQAVQPARLDDKKVQRWIDDHRY